MLIITDLDGTLTLTSHRAHFLQQPTPDWRGFFEACDKDGPNSPIIATVLSLSMWAGHDVRIWTGRSDIVRDKTLTWLRAHHLDGLYIRMRVEGDHTPDHVLKKRWLDELTIKPDLAIEDRALVAQMWWANGVPCLFVTPPKL